MSEDKTQENKVETKEEAIIEIYKRLRPGDPPALEPAEALFENLFLYTEFSIRCK